MFRGTVDVVFASFASILNESMLKFRRDVCQELLNLPDEDLPFLVFDITEKRYPQNRDVITAVNGDLVRPGCLDEVMVVLAGAPHQAHLRC